MRSRRPDPNSSVSRRWAALAFALALLCAQSLGLLHGLSHGPGHGSAASAHHDWFAGHDADGAQCRLVDQLAHHDALTPADAPTVVAQAFDAAPQAWPDPAPRRAESRAFQARAPPAMRA